MLTRTFDARLINQVVNHPEVAPWVRGPLSESLDLSPVVENKDNVLLTDGVSGGFLFTKRKDLPLYEVHTQFLPGTSGVLAKAKEAAFYMFTKTDCLEIMTCVPQVNKAAAGLTKKMHFEFIGTKGTWTIEGNEYPLDYYSLTIKLWATKILCQ